MGVSLESGADEDEGEGEGAELVGLFDEVDGRDELVVLGVLEEAELVAVVSAEVGVVVASLLEVHAVSTRVAAARAAALRRRQDMRRPLRESENGCAGG